MRRAAVLFVMGLAVAPAESPSAGLESPQAVSDSIRARVAGCYAENDSERITVEALRSLEDLSWGPDERVVSLDDPVRPCGPGRVTFLVRVERDRGTVVKPVSVEVRRQVRALAFTRDMDRGEEIGTDDVELRWLDVSRTTADPVSDIATLQSMSVRRRVRSGDIVTRLVVESTPLIRRGDPVTLRFRGRGFEIRVDGTAQDDGHAGSRIRVKNLESGRILRGTVAGPALVEL